MSKSHTRILIVSLLALTCLPLSGTVWAVEPSRINSSISAPAAQSGKIDAKAGSCKNELPTEDATTLDFIRQILADGKPHAAIAHLDAARINDPQANLLRADALRQTGRQEQAAQIYNSLLGNCLSGYAYQGLGLIASNAGNIQQALEYLRLASSALPTDPSIRNDYGYVLMMSGQNKPALHEFLTTVELAPDYRQAANNLILLLYRDNQQSRVQAFADRFGISAEELTHLQNLASLPLPQAGDLPDETGDKQ